MFFRKRDRRSTTHTGSGEAAAALEPSVFRIDYEMMLKGSIYKRRKGVVRQFGVTVNGSTRLVTSGDVVDRETYQALLNAGAIRPAPVAPNANRAKSPVIVDMVASDRAEE